VSDVGVGDPSPEVVAEGSVSARTPEPRTRRSLAADLRRLGLRPRTTVLLHSSLSALGWVAGRQVAVVQALLDVVGTEGTLVVPTHTGANSEPSEWARPPVPEAWWPVIREEMPAYDPAVTPSHSMGAIAELVRTWPGAARSSHPQTSFAAVGAHAAEVTALHDLDSSLGERSPLGSLERLGASVLFLGTGWSTCTALHLAEYRLPEVRLTRCACALSTQEGHRAWVEYDDVDFDEGVFEALGDDYERARPGQVAAGLVGSAHCRLFPLADAVDYAVGWIAAHRAVARS
jgi:aminoglycoside 3-N-acetyltransferase